MRCRCCNSEFEDKAILHYDNMPRMAQNFPDIDGLAEDMEEELNLYQCPYCGMIQIIGAPVSYYKDVIRASVVSKEMRKFRLQYFKNFVTKYNLKNKKILEIGAGCGEFLEIMNQAEVNAYGIEHDKISVDICHKKGLKVFASYIENEHEIIEGAPYDAFFIMNFLEHSPEPNIFIKGIYHNLTEEAVGLIEVPNTDMIFANNMFSEFIRDHLLYFTEETLRGLLQRNGFEVLEIKSVWYDYCMAAEVKKRKKTDVNAIEQKLNIVSKEINQYIEKYRQQGKKVAVWGAGHQALAIISLCNIKEKIEFVVDSAKFKQDKYTPGSHVRVVSPQVLKESKEIAAIIIMAASYSDEVAKIICSDYQGLAAVILRDYGLEEVISG